MNRKKLIKKILKIIWFLIGGILLLIAVVSYIRMKTFTGSGLGSIGIAIGLVIFFTISLGIFLIYLLINGIIFLIKFIRRKKKRK